MFLNKILPSRLVLHVAESTIVGAFAKKHPRIEKLTQERESKATSEITGVFLFPFFFGSEHRLW